MQCYLFGICLVSYSWPPGGCFIGCWARVFYPFTRLPISRSARNISGHPLSIRYKYPLPPPLPPFPSHPLSPPAQKVSGCFTQIVAALGELSFWCAAPSSLWGGWRWYHPQSVYCFWCFGSFLVIRFVLFHLQLHYHFPPSSSFLSILALPFLISRILLRIVSHSVPHYLCISIPVRRQGDVSLKDAFLLPRPPSERGV